MGRWHSRSDALPLVTHESHGTTPGRALALLLRSPPRHHQVHLPLLDGEVRRGLVRPQVEPHVLEPQVVVHRRWRTPHLRKTPANRNFAEYTHRAEVVPPMVGRHSTTSGRVKLLGGEEELPVLPRGRVGFELLQRCLLLVTQTTCETNERREDLFFHSHRAVREITININDM